MLQFVYTTQGLNGGESAATSISIAKCILRMRAGICKILGRLKSWESSSKKNIIKLIVLKLTRFLKSISNILVTDSSFSISNTL